MDKKINKYNQTIDQAVYGQVLSHEPRYTILNTAPQFNSMITRKKTVKLLQLTGNESFMKTIEYAV